VIGFFGGTVYSSFKLAGSNTRQASSQKMPEINFDQESQDDSAQVAAQILKLEQYLKNNPEDAAAWTQIGNLFFDSNQPDNAIDAYEKSLAIEPGKVEVLTDLGVMYRRNKQPQKAIEMFDKVIALDPGFETARFNKGIVLMHDLNDLEAGIKAWEELVKVNPMATTPNGESLDAMIRRIKDRK
jgi:cytochrome c-type biogenesis protein CcmH/NrfG